MSSELLRAGMAAIRDRSLGAVAAFTGGTAGTRDDALTAPLARGWSFACPSRWWAVESISDVRRLLFWMAACVLLLILVAVTNPTEASFRAHLTELAFRRHLAHIRSSDGSPEAESVRGAPATSGTSPAAPNSNGNGSGAETPPIAPFRFANHVAITLRTPSLSYRSYCLFALAITAAPGPPVFLSDPVLGKSSAKQNATQIEPPVVYLGVLGHWLLIGQVPALLQWAWQLVRVGRRDKARKKCAALDRPGVVEMRAVLPKDESPSLGRAAGLVPKLLFKNESHKDLADLLPLHSTPSTLPPSATLVEARSRRGSFANSPSSPSSPDGFPAAEVTSPVLTALKVELAAAQNVLADLRAQLTTHDESVAASQAHLQATLDELRQRRKEDDAERQDLKAKSKTLEDQKRQAEGARRESEKRLKAVEAIRDGVEAKITTALNDIEELRGNMEMSKKHVKIVQDEGAHHLIETRKKLDDKTLELADLEREIQELEATNETLHQQVRDAEDKLKAAETAADDARKMAPEEEMMLMAAAYEAVASETYLHDQRQNQADSQWASQAAAYMAEAGFPHLDQSYTARPTQTAATGYGHLVRAHPNNGSYRSLTDKAANAPPPINTAAVASTADKKLPDVPGFEDFGPGASRSLARPSTPRRYHDLEDLGSPSIPMSNSFSDSWLPQGLVRSLEGDVTPLEGASEIAPSDDEGLDYVASAAQGTSQPSPVEPDSSSDSGGDSPHWPHGQHSDQDHRRGTSNPQNHRFFPNGTSAHNSGSTSTLPGIGSNMSLPSRRWLSSSPSSENLSSSFNLFSGGSSNIGGVGSSDSLPLPGFESAFAPSASEKRALKWPLLGKARWGSNTNGINGLDEIAAGLKDSGHEHTSSGGSYPASSSSTVGWGAEDLFNRVPYLSSHSASPPPPAPPAQPASGFGPWLSARSHFGSGHGGGGGSGTGGQGSALGDRTDHHGGGHRELMADEQDLGSVGDLEGAAGPTADRKASFRFFSLRKGA